MPGLVRRKLGIWPIAATIFFIVCGGPYTTEQVVGKSGPLCGLLILAVLPLVWSLPVGLMTAELSSKMPEEGGYILWVRSAFGPLAGFLCAWWSWTSSWVDLALYPLLAVGYASRLAGPVPHPHVWILVIIAAFTAWNILGIGKVGKFSNLLLIVIMAPFLVLVGFGAVRWLQHPPALNFLNPNVEMNGIGAALVLGLWNYFGWDSLSVASGEVDNASRKFPKAILLAVGLVTAMVVLPVAAGIALKTDWPNWDNDNGYWGEISSAAWPPLRSVIVIGGVLSNIGLFCANLLASSRIPFVLAEERFFPKLLFKLHPKHNTPWVTILIGGVLSALLAREAFDKLVAIDLSLYLLALMLECAALVVLRKRLVKAPNQFEIGGGKAGLFFCAIVPIVIGTIAIFLQLSPSTKLADTPINPIVILTVLVAAGPVAYWFSRLKSA